MSKQYAYSFDEENFTGGFDTPEAAAAEAFEMNDEAECCFVGESVVPIPEDYIDALALLEHVQNQDAFLGEWAEDWPGATAPQLEDLTKQIRTVFADWLDRNKLRPKFFNVGQPVRIQRVPDSKI